VTEVQARVPAPHENRSSSSVTEVSIQVAIVVLTVWRRHENLDVLADRFRRRVAKKPLCRMAERTYDPSFVDHHHGVRNRIEDRGQVRLAGK
jgi:hypothetical protein